MSSKTFKVGGKQQDRSEAIKNQKEITVKLVQQKSIIDEITKSKILKNE